jgi:hypothetical protein
MSSSSRSSTQYTPYTIPYDEQTELLRSFPAEIKFSYERSTHKKVLSDIYVIIPKGRKYFAWFTNRNRKNVCIFLEVGGQNHKITNMFYRHVSFDDSLSYGTIFYGTLFRTNADIESGINDNEIFSVENIYFHKGKDVDHYSFGDKLKLIKTIFDTNLRYNTTFFKKGVVFGLPIITASFMDAYNNIKNLPYSVYSIMYRYLARGDGGATAAHLERSNVVEYYHYVSDGVNNGGDNKLASPVHQRDNIPVVVEPVQVPTPTPTPTPILVPPNNRVNMRDHLPMNSSEISKIFYVKPDIQNDIYYLYKINTVDCSIISDETAHIPDYKTSVLMNKLFRNIKENINLDSLEESDDEEEFENIQLDKFVDLNKTFKMRCIFNHKFRKWVPVNVV